MYSYSHALLKGVAELAKFAENTAVWPLLLCSDDNIVIFSNQLYMPGEYIIMELLDIEICSLHVQVQSYSLISCTHTW